MAESTSTPFATPEMQDELRAARTKVYADEIKTLRFSARRMQSPAERIALAELEREMLARVAQLREANLINALPEGLTA